MDLTRRGALATVGGGVATAVAPTGVAATGTARRPRLASMVQSEADPAFEAEWDRTDANERGQYCTATAPDGEGGIVAVCNLATGELAEHPSGPATQLISVTREGSFSTIGEIGNPEHEPRKYWFRDVEPGIDGGYVLVGYEMQFSPYGTRTDVLPRIVHLDEAGAIDWQTPVEGTAASFGSPEPVAVTATDDQYLVASRDFEGGVGVALAGYAVDGSRRWKRAYDASRSSGANPIQLRRTDRGPVLLALRGLGEGETAQPVLSALAADGTVADRAIPSVSGDRVPTGFAERDGRYLVVGTVPGDGGPSGGWAMELSEFGTEPSWKSTDDGLGAGVPAAAGMSIAGGWVVAGHFGDGIGWQLAGPDASDAALYRTVDSTAAYAAVEGVGDGSVYAAGRAGSGSDATLAVTRLSAALDPGAFEVAVEPTSVEPGDTVSLSIDVTDYDPELLSARWTIDGESLATGFDEEVTIESAGEFTLAATIATEDDRSVRIERTVTAGSSEESGDGDGDDGGGGGGMPGFGLVVGAAGLAGGAALRRRFDSDA